jgi:hypothetical protein
MKRRLVASLAIIVVLLMPSAGMAAQSTQASRATWWHSLLTWIAEASSSTLKKAVHVIAPAEPEPPATTDASSTIDPVG